MNRNSSVAFCKSIECKYCSKVIFFDVETRKFYNSPHFSPETRHYDVEQVTLVTLDKKIDRAIELLTRIEKRLDKT